MIGAVSTITLFFAIFAVYVVKLKQKSSKLNLPNQAHNLKLGSMGSINSPKMYQTNNQSNKRVQARNPKQSPAAYSKISLTSIDSESFIENNKTVDQYVEIDLN